jgi:DNA repair photolyase
VQPQLQLTTPAKMLNAASGYLSGYTHTLNPYAGCAFACSYCYVRQMPISLFRGQPWGEWVDLKQRAAELLQKELLKAQQKGPVTIFMSSSTDPYQPVEYRARITRSLLEVMTKVRPDFVLLQTRSPLVTRDIDLLHALGDRVRVSMTLETDREDVRKAFTPAAPPLTGRIRALQKLVQHGIPVQATVAPLLPCTDRFAQKLADLVDKVCLDDYFMGDGSKGKRTERIGIRSIYERHQMEEWYTREATLKFKEQLETYFSKDRIGISQEGFLP